MPFDPEEARRRVREQKYWNRSDEVDAIREVDRQVFERIADHERGLLDDSADHMKRADALDRSATEVARVLVTEIAVPIKDGVPLDQLAQPYKSAVASVEKMIADLDASHPYGLIVRFAAYTGLRAGELAALRVRDVNLMRRHVEVRRTVQRTKGGWALGTPKSARSVRDVPLPGFLVRELTEYLAGHPHRADPSAGLWPGRLPGGHGALRNAVDWSRPFDVSSVYRYYFKPTLAKLEIRSARWHDLRHFYASVCAHAGVDIRKVSRWMGHANISTTDSIYTHLFNGSATEDMDRLDTLAARPAAKPIARIR